MALDLAAELTSVETRLSKAQARLDEMLDCPRPTYTVDGETFKMTEYQEFLQNLIEKLERRRDILTRAISGGGFTATQAFA